VKRLVILASGSGSNAQAVLDAAAQGEIEAEVVLLVSNRADAGAIARARAAGVAALSLPLASRRDQRVREAYDRQLADVVAAFQPDLIVLAGWMLILSSHFLARFPGRIINVHPALLPDGDGAEVFSSQGPQPALRGPRVVRDALAMLLPLTGATVHFVTETVDSGPVILREEVLIYPDDDEASLHERIKAVEHRLLPRAVQTALAAISCQEESA
jgi:phosphoribosylglycinamide formyltransferase-1